jgi:ketosteroid isomerase-like protein
MKAASKAFYAALAVIDDGTAMEVVWAHTPYVTYAGPSDKSIVVGWDALKMHWAEVNKRFAQRHVALTDQHIHVNGNLGWEMGKETGEGERKDGTPFKADFIVTNVYEKLDGRWLMVSHHVQPKPQ